MLSGIHKMNGIRIGGESQAVAQTQFLHQRRHIFIRAEEPVPQVDEPVECDVYLKFGTQGPVPVLRPGAPDAWLGYGLVFSPNPPKEGVGLAS